MCEQAAHLMADEASPRSLAHSTDAADAVAATDSEGGIEVRSRVSVSANAATGTPRGYAEKIVAKARAMRVMKNDPNSSNASSPADAATVEDGGGGEAVGLLGRGSEEGKEAWINGRDARRATEKAAGVREAGVRETKEASERADLALDVDDEWASEDQCIDLIVEPSLEGGRWRPPTLVRT